MLSRLVPTVPVVIAVALAASCASVSRSVEPITTPSASADTPSTTDRPEATTPLADPPEQFASEGVPVGPQSAIVGHSAAYSYAEPDSYDAPVEIVAIDLRTGQEQWRWSRKAWPSIDLAGPMASTLGIAAQSDGGEQLVHVGTYTDQGTGTTQDDYQVSVAAIDTTSGTELWTASFPLPDGFANDTEVSMTGADEHFVVCSVTAPDQLPRALVIDAATHTAAWTDPGFQPVGLAGTRIIGTQISETYDTSGPLQALTVDTLVPAWTRDELDDPANKLVTPSVVQAPGNKPLSDPNTYLLDVVDGTQIADLPDLYDCVSDLQDTIVCESFNALIGVDAATGQQLWQLPDTRNGRIKPTLLTAFHGRVYAKAEHTAVTLDARTGVDVNTDTMIAPQTVIPGYGLVREDHTLYAHPAIS
jgi:outer membrane protein assembly factor BamB